MHKVTPTPDKRELNPWIVTALIVLPSIAALVQVARVYVKMPLFRERMPELAVWFDAHYRLEREVGTFRIYGRKPSD